MQLVMWVGEQTAHAQILKEVWYLLQPNNTRKTIFNFRIYTLITTCLVCVCILIFSENKSTDKPQISIRIKLEEDK